ncbi:MAG: hypothetical protein VX593_07050 [Pseudomonadota bacterium]|nr:hypothetical protein [Pseudomonadota bacterium]
MQEIFKNDLGAQSEFITLISRERFTRYIQACNGDEAKAVALYCWNIRAAQSLYVYLQCWEIALRNRLNGFLCWKYGAAWPYDERRLIRNLTSNDKRRLEDTKRRQERERRVTQASTSIVVADLSAGFWVSLLSQRYNVPFVWRHNLGRIFSQNQSMDREAAWSKNDVILRLRNRVAHHEPVYNLPLLDLYQDLQHLVGAMCPATRHFAEASCNFREVWDLWHPSHERQVQDSRASPVRASDLAPSDETQSVEESK